MIKGINTFLDLSALDPTPPSLPPVWVGELAGRLRRVKTNQIPPARCVMADGGALKPAGSSEVIWIKQRAMRPEGRRLASSGATSTWPRTSTHTDTSTQAHKQAHEPKWSHYGHQHPVPDELDAALITSGVMMAQRPDRHRASVSPTARKLCFGYIKERNQTHKDSLIVCLSPDLSPTPAPWTRVWVRSDPTPR